MSKTVFGNYVMGLAGLGLVRRWYADDAGAYNKRLVDLATEFADNQLLQYSFETPELDVEAGYELWSASYDGPGNPMINAEEAATHPLFAEHFRPGMKALDAGCGTGRHAKQLAELGYDVVGTDVTEAMLAIARDKVPTADFRQGAFEELPLEDNSVDLITSALAVCHAPDLAPVFSEFARVLKPGGKVVVSDPHPMAGFLGGQAFFGDGSADLPFVRNHAHALSTYASALLNNGFRIDGLDELIYDDDAIDLNPIFGMFPDVVRDALVGAHFIVIWQATLS